VHYDILLLTVDGEISTAACPTERRRFLADLLNIYSVDKCYQ
jgi:hypothetical protein